MCQIGGRGAQPGPRHGAIGQFGGQELGKIIGRVKYRQGWDGAAGAGFPKTDRVPGGQVSP